jgi:hypothetical protein
VKRAGRPEIPREPVDQIATPLAKVMTASVARKGGMRSRATARPFTTPVASPIASIARTPAVVLPGRTPPCELITRAPATLASEITAVTERSIPPVRRTIVWPSETARSGRKLDKTLPRFSGEARPGTTGDSAAR